MLSVSMFVNNLIIVITDTRGFRLMDFIYEDMFFCLLQVELFVFQVTFNISSDFINFTFFYIAHYLTTNVFVYILFKITLNFRFK